MSPLVWFLRHIRYSRGSLERTNWGSESCRAAPDASSHSLAALNGAQSRICCQSSGTQLSHQSTQQWHLTTRGLLDVGHPGSTLPRWWSFTLSSAAMGGWGVVDSGLFHMLPAVYCSWLNAFQSKCVISPQSGWDWLHWLWHLYCSVSQEWGRGRGALIFMHTVFCESVMGTLEGKGMSTQITESKWVVPQSKTSRRAVIWLFKWGNGVGVGGFPLGRPLSWLSCPRKSWVQKKSGLHRRVEPLSACWRQPSHFRQTPRLININAFPLAQQL